MSENNNNVEHFNLNNEYHIGEGSMELATPNTEKLNVIKINQTPEVVQTILIYSTGFIWYREDYADRLIWRTNHPIYQIGDGKFSIEDPEK
ncbi:hypothetical protein [Leuconostoc mesenteroides]|uniref:hypothetical protein n=1 Tax=Leuconostoc TaxID=1243 RepID=UPI0039BCDD90